MFDSLFGVLSVFKNISLSIIFYCVIISFQRKVADLPLRTQDNEENSVREIVN